MECILAFKTNILVTSEQRLYLDKLIDARRWLWNKLHERCAALKPKNRFQAIYEAQEIDFNSTDISSRFVGTVAVSYSRAWAAALKGTRRPPKFKSVRKSKSSFSIEHAEFKVIEGTSLFKLPGTNKDLGKFVLAEPFRFSGKCVCVAISRRDSKYTVAFTIKTDREVKESGTSHIGLDWGVKTFFTDSNSEAYKLPKRLDRLEMRTRMLNNRLSTKVKGSSNYEKVREKLSRAHERMTAIKKDFVEKLTYTLLTGNSLIAIEDLDLLALRSSAHKNRRRAMSQNTFGLFRDRLLQKSNFFTSQVFLADKYFPSSQICSNCGSRQHIQLSERIYSCECGLSVNRDVNAARNLLRLAEISLGVQDSALRI